MIDVIDQGFREATTRLEIALANSLRRDVENGRLSESQADLALELMANKDAYDSEEWGLQWEAWFEWTHETGWR